MVRRIVIVGLIGVLLLAAGTVYAQGPGTRHDDPNWQVAYWNNLTLSGAPVLEEAVAHLGGDWAYGSPHPLIRVDGFSARWSRVLDLDATTYRFAVTSDDGVRVYLDDRLIIDAWYDHPAETFTVDLELAAGHHRVVVEYYENTGIAKVALAWWPLPAGTGRWQGEFYDNRTLSGAPKGHRVDEAIDYDWGTGRVGPGGPSDEFSIRWTGSFHFEGARYRFTATADDGVRVYVDHWLIIDQWRDQPARTYDAELDLDAGLHQVVVEYYEHTGAALIALSWELVSNPPGAWRGEYYSNRWLSGAPALTRSDQAIYFDWGTGAPDVALPHDGFSARWTRTVPLESGLYRFTTTTDDGVRLWVDGHLLIDQWVDQPPRSHSGTIHVSGEVPVRMEYYENGGGALARLAWTRLGDAPPTPPGEVLVDDGDPGFVQGGSPGAWRTGQGGIGGDLTWTQNNDRARPHYNWARWVPRLEAGRYEVYVHVPPYDATTTNARYWVAHADGFALRPVDQSANTDRWVSLGTYRFRGSGAEYVSLSDVTYEPYVSTRIGFDAVKWVSR